MRPSSVVEVEVNRIVLRYSTNRGQTNHAPRYKEEPRNKSIDPKLSFSSHKFHFAKLRRETLAKFLLKFHFVKQQVSNYSAMALLLLLSVVPAVCF